MHKCFQEKEKQPFPLTRIIRTVPLQQSYLPLSDRQMAERPVTGILVLKILVPRTKIFGGELVPLDQNFRKNWSASGNLVLVKVRILTTGLTIGKSIV